MIEGHARKRHTTLHHITKSQLVSVQRIVFYVINSFLDRFL